MNSNQDIGNLDNQLLKDNIANNNEISSYRLEEFKKIFYINGIYQLNLLKLNNFKQYDEKNVLKEKDGKYELKETIYNAFVKYANEYKKIADDIYKKINEKYKLDNKLYIKSKAEILIEILNRFDISFSKYQNMKNYILNDTKTQLIYSQYFDEKNKILEQSIDNQKKEIELLKKEISNEFNSIFNINK